MSKSTAIVIVAAAALSYTAGRLRVPPRASEKPAKSVLYFVDPMHPSYRSDKPGIAPDCGMQLEPVYESSAPKPAAAAWQGAVRLDAAVGQAVGVTIATVEESAIDRTIRAAGRVLAEDSAVYRVNLGVDGFVRDTANDAPGTRVHKNDVLAKTYSPEIVAVASGFLAANERVPGSVVKEGAKSIQNYRDRLRNLGMSDVQITRMAEGRQLPESIDVVSPADGFVLARNVSPGQHFERNMELYRVADLSKVWVSAQVNEQDLGFLKPGAAAAVIGMDGARRYRARVTDSLPQSEQLGGIVRVRLEADNPNFVLRPDMPVMIEIPVRLPAAVTVPLDALLDSGRRARVYVARDENTFEPREIEVGRRFGERVEVIRGLRPGERVAAGATFLIDSESRLKATHSDEAAQPAPPPAPAPELRQVASAAMTKDPSCGMSVDPRLAASSGNSMSYGGHMYYFCSARCKQKFESEPGHLAMSR